MFRTTITNVINALNWELSVALLPEDVPGGNLNSEGTNCKDKQLLKFAALARNPKTAKNWSKGRSCVEVSVRL